MPTAFDPDAGVLRTSHAALSVLATLAVDPTAARLTDHATAPALAQLRAAGIVGSAGIHPDVRPLAEVIGAPRARFDLALAEPGAAWTAAGWATVDLVVLAVPARGTEDAFDLVADAPASAPDLLGDLVGLSSGMPDPRDASGSSLGVLTAALPSSMRSDTLQALLTGAAEEPGVAADIPPVVRQVLGALRAHWRMTVRGEAAPQLEVLDAADAGMWIVRGPDASGAVHLDPADPPRVRSDLGDLLRTALA